MSLFAGLFKKKIIKKKLEIGDTVFLGTYPQENDTPTKVEWIVLNIEEEKALLISKYALITSGYCKFPLNSFRQLEWEGSLAREKCRHFFDECFSRSEQSVICEKRIEMNGFGKDCFDRVFLLSEEEVKLYFHEAGMRKCMPTLKAKTAGARMGWTDDTRDYVPWWVLPECKNEGISTMYHYEEEYEEEYNGSITPKAVFAMGEILYHSRIIRYQDFCIRPSILVEIEKLQAQS